MYNSKKYLIEEDELDDDVELVDVEDDEAEVVEEAECEKDDEECEEEELDIEESYLFESALGDKAKKLVKEHNRKSEVKLLQKGTVKKLTKKVDEYQEIVKLAKEDLKDTAIATDKKAEIRAEISAMNSFVSKAKARIKQLEKLTAVKESDEISDEEGTPTGDGSNAEVDDIEKDEEAGDQGTEANAEVEVEILKGEAPERDPEDIEEGCDMLLEAEFITESLKGKIAALKEKDTDKKLQIMIDDAKSHNAVVKLIKKLEKQLVAMEELKAASKANGLTAEENAEVKRAVSVLKKYIAKAKKKEAEVKKAVEASMNESVDALLEGGGARAYDRAWLMAQWKFWKKGYQVEKVKPELLKQLSKLKKYEDVKELKQLCQEWLKWLEKKMKEDPDFFVVPGRVINDQIKWLKDVFIPKIDEKLKLIDESSTELEFFNKATIALYEKAAIAALNEEVDDVKNLEDADEDKEDDCNDGDECIKDVEDDKAEVPATEVCKENAFASFFDAFSIVNR